jgi:hypothetical protein
MAWGQIALTIVGVLTSGLLPALENTTCSGVTITNTISRLGD